MMMPVIHGYFKVQSLYREVDIAAIPSDVLGKSNVWGDVDGLRFSNAGHISEKTVMERLPSYPGFTGPVIHVNVLSPSPIQDMQRPYVAIDSIQNIPGAWAYEKSVLVLKAPKRLVNTGWMEDPLVILSSIGFHPNNDQSAFRTLGGVNLTTQNGRDYYVSVYRINGSNPAVTPDRNNKAPFKIGRKYVLRAEVYTDDNDQPTFQAFLGTPQQDGSIDYSFIGRIACGSDITEINGYLAFLGGYVGRYVTGFEVVNGEARILR